jgi:1-phosphofructokinase family hexose kinase
MTILAVTLHPAVDKFVRTSKLVPDGISRVEIVSIYAGGKGNNVARALTRMGAPAIATGFQGGYTGTLIEQSLKAEGVATDFVVCKSTIRTSTLIQEHETGHTFAVYEPGQLVDQPEIDALMDRFVKLLEKTSICLLCGSGQTEELSLVYSQMIELAKSKGVRCLVDSSGAALEKALKACPFMLKVNTEELSDLVGKKLETEAEQVAALLQLHKKGVPLVAVSRGPEGLIVTDGKEIWKARLHMPDVINVVGCGDSLLAGIAKSLLESKPLSELARWGVACGTANTQVEGAGFISLSLVESLLPKVELVQLPLPISVQ